MRAGWCGDAMAEKPDRTTYVVQGEFCVSDAPDEILSTVLGSCVAVCLFDPGLRLGGMNHFLLPFGQDDPGSKPVRYGLYAMEMLINALLKRGASKARLQAKLFGAARLSTALRDIGSSNAEFARSYLKAEGIACLAESMGGTNARRVLFRPATGQARQMLVAPSSDEMRDLRKPAPVAVPSPQIELF
jgi:chemotaxis protein CheD